MTRSPVGQLQNGNSKRTFCETSLATGWTAEHLGAVCAKDDGLCVTEHGGDGNATWALNVLQTVQTSDTHNNRMLATASHSKSVPASHTLRAVFSSSFLLLDPLPISQSSGHLNLHAMERGCGDTQCTSAGHQGHAGPHLPLTCHVAHLLQRRVPSCNPLIHVTRLHYRCLRDVQLALLPRCAQCATWPFELYTTQQKRCRSDPAPLSQVCTCGIACGTLVDLFDNLPTHQNSQQCAKEGR